MTILSRRICLVFAITALSHFTIQTANAAPTKSDKKTDPLLYLKVKFVDLIRLRQNPTAVAKIKVSINGRAFFAQLSHESIRNQQVLRLQLPASIDAYDGYRQRFDFWVVREIKAHAKSSVPMPFHERLRFNLNGQERGRVSLIERISPRATLRAGFHYAPIFHVVGEQLFLIEDLFDRRQANYSLQRKKFIHWQRGLKPIVRGVAFQEGIVYYWDPFSQAAIPMWKHPFLPTTNRAVRQATSNDSIHTGRL